MHRMLSVNKLLIVLAVRNIYMAHTNPIKTFRLKDMAVDSVQFSPPSRSPSIDAP